MNSRRGNDQNMQDSGFEKCNTCPREMDARGGGRREAMAGKGVPDSSCAIVGAVELAILRASSPVLVNGAAIIKRRPTLSWRL